MSFVLENNLLLFYVQANFFYLITLSLLQGFKKDARNSKKSPALVRSWAVVLNNETYDAEIDVPSAEVDSHKVEFHLPLTHAFVCWGDGGAGCLGISSM